MEDQTQNPTNGLIFDCIMYRSDDQAEFSQLPNATLKDAIAGGELFISVNGTEKMCYDQMPLDPNTDTTTRKKTYTFTYASDKIPPGGKKRLIGEDELIVIELHTYGVNSMGIPCLRMTAEGAVSVIDLLENNAATILLKYQSSAIFATLLCYNPKLFVNGLESTDGNKLYKLDPNSKVTKKDIQTALSTINVEMQEVMKMREGPLLYKRSPALTKPFTYAGPFDLESVAGSMDRPTNWSADVLETVLRVGLDIELVPKEDLDTNGVLSTKIRAEFIERNATHTMHSLRNDAKIAAEALRNVYRSVRDYDPDGPFIRGALPGSTSRTTTEWWANRFTSHPLADDDCDGIKELVIIMSQIGISPVGDGMWKTGEFVSSDKTYDKTKHKVTKAIRNALFNHSVGLCIVSANASSGTEVKVDGGAPQQALAGHAILLLLPKIKGVLAPIQRGVSDKKFPRDLGGTVVGYIKQYKDVLFPENLIAQMNLSDKEAIQKALALDDMATATNIGDHEPYVIDGTITSKVTIDESKDASALERLRTRIVTSMGSLVAHRVSDIARDFYVHCVEISFPGMQEQNVPPTYVFANAHNKWGHAGVEMEELYNYKYELVPLLQDTKDVQNAFITLSNFAKKRAMMPIDLPITLQHVFQTNLDFSKKVIQSFKEAIKVKAAVAKAQNIHLSRPTYIDMEFRITPRHMLMAPNFVETSLNTMLAYAVSGDVDEYPIPGIAQFADTSNALYTVVIAIACKA